MKKSENLIQKLFGSFAIGNSRIPLRSNVFNKGGRGGYSPIGQTGNSRLFDSQRQSPLLGNSSPSNRISGYLDRVSELKGYQLLDISKLAVNFFADYIVNFLKDSNQQVVTILDDDGNNNVLRAVMAQFRNLKQVICNTRHELSGLLVIIKPKGKLLEMTKDIIPHIVFHLGTHHMSLIGNEIIATQLQ